MLLVTTTFANNYLQQRIAEIEFDAAKQFMQTTGLQLDDVSWTIGRTQTIRYASTFGQVNFENETLNYTIFVNDEPIPIGSFTTGVLFFNMPTNKYNLGNNYYQRVYPANSSFLQAGTSAPVSSVFVIEVVPMNDGNYIRVVVAPSIRTLNSTITMGNTTKNYYNFYLPLLRSGNHPRLSQSITLQGTNVSAITNQGINKIKIQVYFPKSSQGFDDQFFRFESQVEEILVPAGSILGFYTSEVKVSLGLQG
jgi:hypothetical protein